MECQKGTLKTNVLHHALTYLPQHCLPAQHKHAPNGKGVDEACSRDDFIVSDLISCK